MARQDFFLGDAPYLLTHADGQKTLQQKWVVEGGQTVAWVKANIVPNLFARYNGLNWTDAEVMAMTLLPAYWNDAVISGLGGGQPITGVITSNNGVTVPAGVYLVNYPCITDGGHYLGQGTGFAGTPGGAVSMNTNLVYDRAGWIGGIGSGTTHLDGQSTVGGVTTNIIYDQRNLITSVTWQVLSGGRSYTESGLIDGFRLTGDNSDWYKPAQPVCNGMGLWDPGETSKVGRIFAESFNGYGVKLVRGTPATIDCLSAFVNALGGINLCGTSLCTANINTLSGDDNPALIVQTAGYGRVAGGTLNVNLGKSESGKRSPNKGQIILWQQDECVGNININVGQADMNNQFLDAQFVVKPNNSSGGLMVKVQFAAWNFRTTFHDVTNGKRWPGTAYRPEFLIYTSRNNNGGTLLDGATGQLINSSTVNATDRLGLVANGGSFDYANGTPQYDITGGAGPVPPQCSWVVGPWGAWGPCVNGSQDRTRSVTTSIPGCTPADPEPISIESQACGTPPPPPPPPPPSPTPGTTLFSINFSGKNVLALPGCKVIPSNQAWSAGTITAGRMTTNINTKQQFATPITGVSRIVLKSCVINDPTSFKWLNDEVRSNGATKLYLNSAGSGSAALGTFAQNAAPVDIVINFSTPVTIDYLLGFTSNSLIMSLAGVDILG